MKLEGPGDGRGGAGACDVSHRAGPSAAGPATRSDPPLRERAPLARLSPEEGPGGATAKSSEPVSPAIRRRLEELERAGRAFEALLFREMLKTMLAGSTEQGLFGSGAGREAYQELFESGLAEALAGRAGLGIAELVVRQFEGRVASEGPEAAQGPPGTADPEEGTGPTPER